MLDFYSIPDNIDSWTEPVEDKYIGSLSLEEFDVLGGYWTKLTACDLQLSFFEDARWKSSNLCVALEQLSAFADENFDGNKKEREKIDNAMAKIKVIFESSLTSGEGIMSFCD
ncbi:hypothetical protein [Aeoliella sp.]|uniref:hypothetical protein n=1 Tax=Aeoliella sp. TaxID=2795800 RepID=UPI003CCB9C69